MGFEILRYLVFFFAVQYVLLLLVIGRDAVKSPQWDRRFREAGALELYRRGVFIRKNTVDELSALQHMVGNDPPGGCREDNGDTYEVIAIIGGSTDRARMGAELDRLRSRLLGVALERQFCRVKNVHNIKWVHRLWFAQSLLSSAEVTVRGAIWMVPRSIAVVGNSFGTFGKHVSASAVLFGTIWWGLSPRNAEMSSVVSSLAGAGLIGGVFYAVGRVWWAVLVARFGGPETWQWSGVLGGLGWLVALGAVFALAVSGTLQKTTEAMLGLVDHLEPMDGNRPAYWQGIVLLGVYGWAVRSSIRCAANPVLVTKDRLGFVMTAVMFIGMGVACVGMVLNVGSRGFVIAAGCLISGSFCGIGAVIVFLTVRDRLRQGRVLSKAGYTVPRKGFRCWALVTWIVVFGALVVWSELTTSGPSSATYVVEQWTALVVILTLMFSFVPGVIVTYLYIRRIDLHFSRSSIRSLDCRYAYRL